MNDTSPSGSVRIAVVQMDVRIGENDANFTRVQEYLSDASGNGANIVVFPECALSGYCFSSLMEALPYRDDERLIALGELTVAKGVVAVLGHLSGKAGVCHNSASVCLPNGERHIYHKTHLPTLGIDRFAQPGNELNVLKTPFGRLGVLICYDIRFPETARTLALLGADIVALPTNWPEGAESAPDFLLRARAWENRVYVAAADRVGTERGRRFIGRSQIVSPLGTVLAEAGPNEETILYADIDINIARNKRIVLEQGEWELDPVGDRRPELYLPITESNKL